VRIYGVDFTCAPRRAKPITVAAGVLKEKALRLEELIPVYSFEEFEAFLRRPGPWVGGFDFPFSLPAELARDLAWPPSWPELVSHCASMNRLAFRNALDLYRNSRKPGSKYAHRATDHPAGSSSPMKLVNPPVALMFHEGARRLVDAGLSIPFLRENGSDRVALEAYPGLLVRKQLGIRASYKSDTRAEQTPARTAVRKQVLSALKEGRPLGIRVQMERKFEKQVVADGSGDLLDALICAAQAAWAAKRPGYGLPAEASAGEGWIVTA
jgi:hypothetical protein